jgi:small subunit ribosomal protein S7e
MIPYPCLKVYQKVAKKLIPELERRLKLTVFVTAKRTLDSKWVKKHRSQMRPRSRTLTAVYDGLLEDLCSPGTIIGRR